MSTDQTATFIDELSSLISKSSHLSSKIYNYKKFQENVKDILFEFKFEQVANLLAVLKQLASEINEGSYELKLFFANILPHLTDLIGYPNVSA